MNDLPRTAAPSPPSRPARWYWPPRPLACVVAGLTLVVAFLATFVGVESVHVSVTQDEFRNRACYDHGWPATYLWRARRDPSENAMAFLEPSSAWTPWRGVIDFSAAALLADVAIWLLAILLIGAAAQWWRSNRRALWKPHISDLLGFVTVAGVALAWIADQRFAFLNERAALAEHRERHGDRYVLVSKSSNVPGFVPMAARDLYCRVFDRATYFESQGDTDLACRCRHVVMLREALPGRTFRRDLTQMSQLEAIVFRSGRLPYTDVTRQATILRELPPLPNLRAVDLYGSLATDSDMAWLATCPRLEMIELSNSHVGDHGLLALRELPRLWWLSLSGCDVTDRGCQTLAEYPALEELRIASRGIHDEGIRELAKMKNLHVLNVSASASETAFADLRAALPKCQITTRAY